DEDIGGAVAVHVGDHRRADARGEVELPEEPGVVAAVADGIQVSMAGAEQEFGSAVAVDVAGGDTACRGGERQLPTQLAGGDLDTGEPAILPAEAHQPAPVRKLQKPLRARARLANLRELVPERLSVSGHGAHEVVPV